jgi:hypothetical protein
MRRYVDRRESVAYPRLASPRGFAWLWLIVVMIIASALGAMAIRIPVYRSALAVAEQRSPALGDRPVFAILVKREDSGLLSAGETVAIESKDRRNQVDAEITRVEEEPMGAAEAAEHVGLGEQGVLQRNERFVVSYAQALRRSAALCCEAPATLYDARVRVGSRRAIWWLIPGNGRLGP